jgi:hypothetical protein
MFHYYIFLGVYDVNPYFSSEGTKVINSGALDWLLIEFGLRRRTAARQVVTA